MMRLQRRKVLVGAGAALLATPIVLRAQPMPFRFGLTPVFLDNDWQLLTCCAHISAQKWGARSSSFSAALTRK